MHRHAKNNDFPIDFVIFTKALGADGPTDGPTDGLTDGRTYPIIEMRKSHLKRGHMRRQMKLSPLKAVTFQLSASERFYEICRT